VWEDFTVLSAAVYDSLFGATALSTYAGGDTSGTTSLLGRLTAPRAGNLDNLDAAVTSRSTYAGADTSGTGTLLARLTATRAGYLDALAGLIALDSGAVAAGTSATVFTSTSGGLNATSGAYTGQTLIFTTGANKGERRTISTHTLSTGTHTFTLSAALTATPSAADAFVIA
jgi:hypothetical protein